MLRTNCKLCQRPSSKEVNIVHEGKKNSSLSPGYCLDCQEWVFMSFLMVIAGLGTILAGFISLIISFDFTILAYGILVLVSGPIFLSIVGMFIKTRE